MAAMSDALENALLNATLRNVAYTSPAAVYIALHTADPTDAGTGAEVTGGSYARQSMTFAAPTNGSSANNANATFTNMPAVTVTHIAIWSAATAGSLLYYVALTTSKTTAAGNNFTIASGDITVTLA